MEDIPIERIRNFSIIAHIDHGKSTLADRILVLCGAVSSREMRDQMLDSMDLERERGITIKAQSVALKYTYQKKTYLFNLIDTPGHVDFTYEVSRSLAACEGAILLVDASQGVEAQTVANTWLALENNLEIIPVLNKIDLVNARPQEVAEEIHNVLGLDTTNVLNVSGKTGKGVDLLLERIIQQVPPPKGTIDTPLRALVFDSYYDDYRGVVTYLRVMDGKLQKGDKIYMMGTGTSFDTLELGTFTPRMVPKNSLSAGEVGYLVGNLKSLREVKIGDTVTLFKLKDQVTPLPGYVEPKPMVFCGIYPTIHADFPSLRVALEKLQLNDPAFSFTPEHSDGLGAGFRCGFLGLLHMEIVQERLEREFDVDLVQTAPTVTYKIITTKDEEILVSSPSQLPPETQIKTLMEPMVELNIIVPKEFVGAIMQMCTERRGTYIRTEYLSEKRTMVTYHVPLAEIIYDFYDNLKSATRGYGTMDYNFLEFKESDLVRLRILVNTAEVDALSLISHRESAPRRGREILKKLQKEIPRHLFQISLQAAIGGKIVARENISPLRKNVTSKCYGGDITRKRKLLDKQKEGKKRMKTVGNVEIPQKAFMAILETTKDDD